MAGTLKHATHRRQRMQKNPQKGYIALLGWAPNAVEAAATFYVERSWGAGRVAVASAAATTSPQDIHRQAVNPAS